ncbi:hypothetical protein RZS08_57650, partial [Arthrospira platensis SPKY1]|nr:hypothetical protein [Arthrospira platensis SPKY1]
MKALIQFEYEINTHHLASLRAYFEEYKFQFEENSNTWCFYRNTGLLASWNTNPLRFASQIVFSFENQKCQASVEVDSKSTIFTKEAQMCWEVFFQEMNQVIKGSNPQTHLIEQAINNAKKSIRFNHIFVVVGMLIGGGIGQLLYSYFKSQYFMYMGILIGG